MEETTYSNKLIPDQQFSSYMIKYGINIQILIVVYVYIYIWGIKFVYITYIYIMRGMNIYGILGIWIIGVVIYCEKILCQGRGWKKGSKQKELEIDASETEYIKKISSPLIGVLVKPIKGQYPDLMEEYKEAYGVVEMRWMQWLEAGGGRPVAIDYRMDKWDLEQLMNKLNGVFLTGGDNELLVYTEGRRTAEFTPYMHKAHEIISIAMEFNRKGTYFPLYGICLGFEAFILSFANDPNALQCCLHSTCINYNANTTLLTNTSRMFSHFPPNDILIMATQPKIFNYHKYYIDENVFRANNHLQSQFNIVALSQCPHASQTYVSAIESKKYPFYAVQGHPEKSNYHFSANYNIVHDMFATRIAFNLANFFVEETRKNNHKFKDYEHECQAVVYNNNKLYFGPNKESVYIFI